MITARFDITDSAKSLFDSCSQNFDFMNYTNMQKNNQLKLQIEKVCKTFSHFFFIYIWKKSPSHQTKNGAISIQLKIQQKHRSVSNQRRKSRTVISLPDSIKQKKYGFMHNDSSRITISTRPMKKEKQSGSDNKTQMCKKEKDSKTSRKLK